MGEAALLHPLHKGMPLDKPHPSALLPLLQYLPLPEGIYPMKVCGLDRTLHIKDKNYYTKDKSWRPLYRGSMHL